MAGPGYAHTYTHSDSAKGRTGTAWMPSGGTRWGAHWRHLANMTELSIYSSDAALCQITLTTENDALYMVHPCI